MKNTVKYWVFCMALLMIIVSVSSCFGDNPAGTTANPDNVSTEPVSGNEGTFKVEKFADENTVARYTIAARNERSDYLVAKYDADVMHRKTYDRNSKLEELFNIEISLDEIGHSDGDAFKAALDAEYYGQNGAWDLVCPAWWWGTDMKGYYVNLLEYQDEIDVSDPWWFDGFNKNVTFAGYMSSIMGDAQFDTYYNMEAVFYNKDIANDLGFDPYSYVDNMTWTLEVADEFGKLAWSDNDGDGVDFMEGDIAGSLINESSLGTALYSLGVKYADNIDGEVNFRMKEEHNYDVFRKLYSFLNENDYNKYARTSTLGAEATTPFTNGQVLFLWQCFRIGPTLRKADNLRFGILPCPMYDTNQNEYISAVYDITLFCVMTTAPDKHMSTLVLNAMNAITDEYMTNHYFDNELGLKLSNDENSSRMIPLIRDALYCDFTQINYDQIGNEGKYAWYIANQNPNVANVIEREYDLYVANLNKMREKMVEFRDRDV